MLLQGMSVQMAQNSQWNSAYREAAGICGGCADGMDKETIKPEEFIIYEIFSLVRSAYWFEIN